MAMAAARYFLLLAIVGLGLGVELTPEQEEKMPDFGDPLVAKKLKCSACRASAVEFHEALTALRAKRGRARIREYEYTEVMDEVCTKGVEVYGLQLRNNFPTQKFSKDVAISRAHGNWAGRYLQGICSDMYQEYEDDLKELQHEDLAAFAREMCRDRMKSCTPDDLVDPGLGDEVREEKPPREGEDGKKNKEGKTVEEL